MEMDENEFFFPAKITELAKEQSISKRELKFRELMMIKEKGDKNRAMIQSTDESKMQQYMAMTNKQKNVQFKLPEINKSPNVSVNS
jgi:uncharacterized protein YxeA